MKEYPSISGSFRGFEAYVFDKLDGSNLRFEWTRKRGWHKYGARHRLFDETDHQFAPAVKLFHETLAEPCARVAVDRRWDKVIIFAEYFGQKSFAGFHVDGDPKTLTVFDVLPEKKGLLGPREFLKFFGENANIPTAAFLGHLNWTRGFIDRVWNGDVPGVTLEGVIGKAGSDQTLVMAKAKTRVWIEGVRARFTSEEAEKIINS